MNWTQMSLFDIMEVTTTKKEENERKMELF